MDSNKKMMYIGIGVVAVAIIGFLIWKYWNKPSFPPSQYNSNNSLDSSVNTTMPKGNKIVSPSGNAALVLGDDGDLKLMLGSTQVANANTGFAPIGNCVKLLPNGSLAVFSAEKSSSQSSQTAKWSTQPLTNSTANFILTVSETPELMILNFDTGVPTKVNMIPLPPPVIHFPPSQYNASNSMDSVVNTTLNMNQKITSKSGKAWMAMQTDGNLVVYTNSGNNVLTSSSSQFSPLGHHVTLTSNGAMILYDKSNTAIATTGVLGNSKYILTINDDGSLHILDFTTGKDNLTSFPIFPPQQYTTGAFSMDSVKWKVMGSGGQIYSPSGKATMRMQPDGNLVTYIGGTCLSGSQCTGGKCVNYSNTMKNEGATLTFSSNGQLSVIPKGGGNPLWSSTAYNVSRYILTVDDNGNVHVLNSLTGDIKQVQFPSQC